jgi:hypothetical protein
MLELISFYPPRRIDFFCFFFASRQKRKLLQIKKELKKLNQASLPYFGLEKNALRKLIG